MNKRNKATKRIRKEMKEIIPEHAETFDNMGANFGFVVKGNKLKGNRFIHPID